MYDEKYRCYCFRNGVTVGVEGSVNKMEIGCSEVNVMVQECRYDEQEFFHNKKRHTDTRSCVRCSIGVGSFTNNGSGVNDPNNP